MNSILRKFGIFPHNGKRIIFLREEQLYSGLVIYDRSLTGAQGIGPDDPDRLKKIVEAANAKGVSPEKIEASLKRGENILFKPRLRG